MKCVFEKSIFIALDYDTEDVVIKKCCIKRQDPNFIRKYSIEEFRSLDLKKLLDELQYESDGVRQIKKVCKVNEKDEPLTECYFPNSKIEDVHISFQTGCNSHCIFCTENKCRHTKHIENRVLNHEFENQLEYETLEKLKGRVKNITLTHTGEPLLYKESFIKFLNGLKEGDFSQVSLTTNGTNLDDDVVDAINNSKVTVMPVISLNATKKETRKGLMGLDDFDKVVANYKKLKLCGLSFVVTQENKDELEEFKEMSPELTHIILYEGGVKRAMWQYPKEYDMTTINENEGITIPEQR